MPLEPLQFQQQLLAWFDQHGRKDLPWQHPNTPYRVWLSEVMLQQTQVLTVIPYFQRFINRFPDLKSLAKASIDEVLQLWAGLGYYARARNLHRTAQIILEQYAGEFPQSLTTLQSLPGIGRSTAGAILALSMNQRAPILDGNVKRVLARLHAINGNIRDLKTIKQLWELAEYYTPQKRIADFTQAMMDLGALICTRSKPQCSQCPFHSPCLAYKQNTPTAYPVSKIHKPLQIRTIHLLALYNEQGELLLEKRPPVGIWGGLWSLPECPLSEDIIKWCKQNKFCEIDQLQTWPSFRHTFSHFHLDITPVTARVIKWHPRVMETNSAVWYNMSQNTKGLPAPVKKILIQLGPIIHDPTNTLPKT